jgi:rhomboid protease GluP
MPSPVVIRLLLWAVALNAGFLLVVLWRRSLAGRGGYAALLGALTLAAGLLLATRRESHPLAFVVIGCFVFLVVVPHLLRLATGWALGRGRLDLAIRLTALREHLQPGAGVDQERRLLQTLGEVQSEDPRETLARMEARLPDEPDPEVRAVLTEQIVAIYALERRFAEAAAFAQEHVSERMVAERPRLGAALVRVHGELGSADAVVQTMSLVEGSNAAQEPVYAELLDHCRIMTLAFLGEAATLEALLHPDRAEHGPEPKVRHYWLGVAHQHAGDLEAARAALAASEQLLEDGDDRARESIAARRAALDAGEARPLPRGEPALAEHLVQTIQARIALTLARPRLEAATWRTTWMTLALLGVNLAVFGATELLGRGSTDPRTLVLLGASLKAAVDAGELFRLVTAMFLHAGWFHLLLNAFMLWYLGRFCEQLVGPLRLLSIYVIAGITGNLASHLLRDGPISVGASSALFGVLGATLVVLLRARGRLPEGWRRSMVVMLVVLILLSFLPGLDVQVIDNYAHLGGLAGGAAAGLLLAGPRAASRPGRIAAALLGGATVVALVLGLVGLATSRLDRLPWATSQRGGFAAPHPVSYYAVAQDQYDGLVLLDLLTEDTTYVLRFHLRGPTTTDALFAQRWQEAQDPAGRRDRSPVARLTRLTDLPPAWRGYRLDATSPDGKPYVRLRAHAVGAHRGQTEEWMAEIRTTPDRAARRVAELRRTLRGVRRR